MQRFKRSQFQLNMNEGNLWKLEKTWQDGKALSHPSKVFCFLLDESSGFQAYLNFSQWKWRLLHSEVMRIVCFLSYLLLSLQKLYTDLPALDTVE